MTRRGIVLRVLREAGERGATTGELLDAGAGSRFGARIRELREQGHRIEARRVRDGAWRYWLRDAGAGVGPTKAAADSDPSDAEADVPVAPPATASLPADGGGHLFPIEQGHRARGHHEPEDAAA